MHSRERIEMAARGIAKALKGGAGQRERFLHSQIVEA